MRYSRVESLTIKSENAKDSNKSTWKLYKRTEWKQTAVMCKQRGYIMSLTFMTNFMYH